MTTPVEPTLNQSVSLASVDELVSQARRLGIVWDLRPGVVQRAPGAQGPYDPLVALDGDDVVSEIQVSSLVGGVAPGMRVMVMLVPPVGNYIIGILSTSVLKRFEKGALTSHGTTITTVETVMETIPDFVVLAGAAYRYEIDGYLLAATTTLTRFRVRKNTVGGQSLGASDAWPGLSLTQAPFRHVGYFRNVTRATITADIVLTAFTLSSTSTWGADSELPRYVSIQYAGPAIEYPSAVGIT